MSLTNPIFNKQKTVFNDKIVKNYRCLGLDVLAKEKSSFKRVYKIFGVKITLKRKKPLFFPANDGVPAQSLKKGVPELATIKKLIASPNIKVISFDIFDTLLLRPTAKPEDIFRLISLQTTAAKNIDFAKLRRTAESELKKSDASLDDIWDYIQKKHHLAPATALTLKQAELEAERRLLFCRADIYELYQYAVSLGKKIIAVSDMYLPADFLSAVLKEKGYKDIARVYVSNEYHKRKDTGDLYQTVITTENVMPAAILHIGDNYRSDFKMAVAQNLTAVYYPSVDDILSAPHSVWRQIRSTQDISASVILSWCLNRHFGDINNAHDTPAVFADFRSLIRLGLFPVVMHIALSIANNKTIQNKYSRILFASRDGFLPKLCYDILAQNMRLLPSEYIYAGRRAYFSAIEKDMLTYITGQSVDKSSPYTIQNLLDAYITDAYLKREILAALSAEEKKLDLSRQKDDIIKALSPFRTKLNAYMTKHQKEAKAYYAALTAATPREIVFDCGYSGSISTALTRLLHKPIDKIYLWQTGKNKQQDKKNHTKTFTLMHEKQLFPASNIIYEELFSPLANGCIGFQNGKPLFEPGSFSTAMRQEFTLISQEISELTKSFCADFAPWLPYLVPQDTLALQQPLVHAFTRSPYNETKLLENICFPDPVYTSASNSLAYKVQKDLPCVTTFSHTGFENPDNSLTPLPTPCPQNFRLGIHCHLYNVYLYQELFEYLKDFPAQFDLILTVCDKQKIPLLQNIFTAATIPNLHNLILQAVPNRGRDVAPWLVATKPLQQQYDLFCHIHGKESPHFNFGPDWRRYLFANLISAKAAASILNHFQQMPDLGMVFPDIFPPLRTFCITHQIRQEGMYEEEKIINRLLQQMDITKRYSLSDIFFSEGTMLWYRPKALAPLFDLNLAVKDFPPEPIGTGGTIAHAIERLPAVVCRHCGYTAKSFTPAI